MKIRRVDFSPDEWIAGTVMLDNAERGLYITACALIYSNGGPIPVEQLRLASLDHGRAFNRQIARLISLGKLTENEGKISNKRCENELEKAIKRAENARENGGKSNGRPYKNSELQNQPGISAEKLTINHQLPTIEKGSLSGAQKSRATFLPDGFVVPAEWIAAGRLAREKAKLPPSDLATEAIKFVNHFLGSDKSNARKRDWRRTFINWALNAKGATGNVGRASAVDSLIEGFGRAVGLGGPPDSEPDWSSAGPLLDGEYARYDA